MTMNDNKFVYKWMMDTKCIDAPAVVRHYKPDTSCCSELIRFILGERG